MWGVGIEKNGGSKAGWIWYKLRRTYCLNYFRRSVVKFVSKALHVYYRCSKNIWQNYSECIGATFKYELQNFNQKICMYHEQFDKAFFKPLHKFIQNYSTFMTNSVCIKKIIVLNGCFGYSTSIFKIKQPFLAELQQN